MPADNITKNMRAVFERNNVATQNNGSGPAPPAANGERSNPPKVNRFVVSLSTESDSGHNAATLAQEHLQVNGDC